MKRARDVWVILHCEWVRKPEDRFIDEMVFHVASSLKAAECYVRELQGMPKSWWKIERFPLDKSVDAAQETRLYNHKGTPRKSPMNAAFRYFEKYSQD